MRQSIYIIVVLMFANITVHAQQQMIDAANAYMRDSNYVKAAETFKVIYLNNSANKNVYEPYIKALLQMGDIKAAEETIKQSLKFENSNELQLQLAQVYIAKKETKKANKLINAIIEQNATGPNAVDAIANLFIQNNMADKAIEIYEVARKKSGDPNLFASELANIYNQQGNFEKATESLLEVAMQNPYKTEDVKTGLLRIFKTPENISVVRKKILARIQAEPQNTVFPDILSWLYIQQNDYENAFIQVKAMDIRLAELGRRPYNFARIAGAEKKYDAAIMANNYIINELGEKSPYYKQAQSEKINCLMQQLQNTPNYTIQQVEDVVSEYANFIEKNPEAKYTVAQKNFANLLVRYANNVPQAIEALQEIVKAPQANNILRAQCKLDLGDYYLIDGNSWEAILLYSQVDKEFKNDMLAEEARFRNAKLSYYMADYAWAQGQLDVLKASTSELIANDALNLSVLITEGVDADSNYTPLQMFSRADLLIFQNKNIEANETLDSIAVLYPEHPLQDNVLMAKAIMAYNAQNYQEALGFYNKVYTKHGQDILADDALYNMALLQENFLNNAEEAKNLYEKLILEYPASTFINQSRKAFRKLRGDVLEEK